MKFNSLQWLTNLSACTHSNMKAAKEWLLLSDEILLQRPEPNKWNALECMEHLNRYGDFYLPEFLKRIERTRFKAPDAMFKPGWLGNYFTKSMEPKPNFKKMKTFKEMNPFGMELSKEVIRKFLQQQETFLAVIEKAKEVDINKTRTSISISKFITLKLGDSLAFFTAHNTRHIEQAKLTFAKTTMYAVTEMTGSRNDLS